MNILLITYISFGRGSVLVRKPTHSLVDNLKKFEKKLLNLLSSKLNNLLRPYC